MNLTLSITDKYKTLALVSLNCTAVSLRYIREGKFEYNINHKTFFKKFTLKNLNVTYGLKSIE